MTEFDLHQSQTSHRDKKNKGYDQIKVKAGRNEGMMHYLLSINETLHIVTYYEEATVSGGEDIATLFPPLQLMDPVTIKSFGFIGTFLKVTETSYLTYLHNFAFITQKYLMLLTLTGIQGTSGALLAAS